MSLFIFSDVFVKGSKAFLVNDAAVISGIIIFVLGQVVRISARGFKSEQSKNGHLLIQDGPYSLVRNPMYLGILLITLGTSLIILKWWAVCFFMSLFIVRYRKLILNEEEKLRKTFAEKYVNYQKKVPRLLPDVSILLTKEVASYLPLKFSWVKKEFGSMSMLLFAAFLLSSWGQIRGIGTVIYVRPLISITVIMGLFFYSSIMLIHQTKEVLEKCVKSKRR